MTLEHGGDLFAAQQVYSGEILDFSGAARRKNLVL